LRGAFAGLGEEVADSRRADPDDISTKLDPVTEKKGTSASPATARASRVFPVPGGPTMSTPRGATAPARR
jgi:hypothetical protein